MSTCNVSVVGDLYHSAGLEITFSHQTLSDQNIHPENMSGQIERT